MKLILTVVSLFFAGTAFALPANINSSQAKAYLNQNANVCGKVVRIGSGKNGDRFLNIDGSYPNEIFYFYVPPSTTNINLNQYLNKNICGYGRVEQSPRSDINTNRIIPQIIIKNESQISFY